MQSEAMAAYILCADTEGQIVCVANSRSVQRRLPQANVSQTINAPIITGLTFNMEQSR